MIGYYFSLGSGVVSWVNKKQSIVALSSNKAEYKSSCFASCEAVWLRMILGEMGAMQNKLMQLSCDN